MAEYFGIGIRYCQYGHRQCSRFSGGIQVVLKPALHIVRESCPVPDRRAPVACRKNLFFGHSRDGRPHRTACLCSIQHKFPDPYAPQHSQVGAVTEDRAQIAGDSTDICPRRACDMGVDIYYSPSSVFGRAAGAIRTAAAILPDLPADNTVNCKIRYSDCARSQLGRPAFTG